MDDESPQEPEEVLNAIRGARKKEKREPGYVNVCNNILIFSLLPLSEFGITKNIHNSAYNSLNFTNGLFTTKLYRKL